MAAKGKSHKTCLESTAGTGTRYYFTSPALIGKQIKKFDRRIRKHVLFKGIKVK